MTATETADASPLSIRPRRFRTARTKYPARLAATDWDTTHDSREVLLQRLTQPPFTLAKASSQEHRASGLAFLLDFLADQPGETWQQRWLASGADTAGLNWRAVSTQWLLSRGDRAAWRQAALSAALVMTISADIIRPSLTWLVSGATGRGALVRNMARSRDPAGFATLRAQCQADSNVTPAVLTLTLHRSAEILAAKGGTLNDITVGDVLELLDTEAATHPTRPIGPVLFYHHLHLMGVLGADAPASLREVRTNGQLTVEQLIDRYDLSCRPVRDLLVDYLRERQPTLDYTSLTSLAHYLGKIFWQDLEHHHPGIDSLRLPAEVVTGWKQRLQTMPKTVRTATGDRSQVMVQRINVRECLTPVRSFYLDLAHWAVDDPARWGPWVAPCPIGAEEADRRKAKRRHKARMDARTRERLPVLPVLVRSVNERRLASRELLDAARNTAPGATFTAGGETLSRSITPTAMSGKVWADDPASGKRRDLTLEEDHAFWTWAAVEVLRATGVRIEELLELSHHSLVQYRLPSTGELIPLLQIAPSKTDAERLVLVSPELAEVLAAIINRVRERTGAVPLVIAYDPHECTWSRPAPLLFQRRHGSNARGITADSVRRMLSAALTHTGLVDTATGGPLRYTPHDFRRLFITDAILNGLPPHIAQVIAGHKDINVTLGYKAIYPEEAIQAHLSFLARRRALRPSEEYRTPTDEEWLDFLGHFERRKVSIGACGRAFSTPCIHEHACIRCPMLWPDPAQRPRLVEIRDNLQARIEEAERQGWLGEVEGLRISLAGAEDKLTQVDRRNTQVDLGMPQLPRQATTPEAGSP